MKFRFSESTGKMCDIKPKEITELYKYYSISDNIEIEEYINELEIDENLMDVTSLEELSPE